MDTEQIEDEEAPYFEPNFDPSKIFSREDIVSRLQFVVAEYRTPLLSQLENSHLSRSARLSLKGTVDDLFDQNSMLTNLQDRVDLQILLIQAEISLNLALKDFDAVDLMYTNLPKIEYDILDYYKKMLFRAMGPDRERRQQNKAEYSQEQIMKQTMMEPPKRQKRGILR